GVVGGRHPHADRFSGILPIADRSSLWYNFGSTQNNGRPSGCREGPEAGLSLRRRRSRSRMAKASSMSPKLADLKYRVVNELGTGAGSTILLIADKKTGK